MTEFEIFSNNSDSSQNLQAFINEGQNAVKNFSIKNNSDQPVEFEIFTQSAVVNENQTLLLSDHAKEKQNLSAWIKLPVKKITVPANSTESVPIHIQIPLNANRGEHQAVVIARPTNQKNEQGLSIIHQKGLTITNTIGGPQTAKLVMLKDQQYKCGESQCFSYTFQNQGTSLAKLNVSLQIKNEQDYSTQFFQKELELSRGEASSTTFEWKPPMIGQYSTTTSLYSPTPYAEIPNAPQSHNFHLFPFWIAAVILIILIAAGIGLKKGFKRIKAFFKGKKEAQFFSILFSILFIGAIIQQLLFPLGLFPIFAQETESGELANSYLTIQWGNVRQIPLPSTEEKKQWNFEVSVENGFFYLDSHLDFENTDSTETLEEKKRIQVIASTNNDIDGIILQVSRDKTKDPIIHFKDNLTQKTTSHHLSDLSNEQLLSNDRQSIHILQSDMYYKAKRFFIYSQEEDLIDILEATEDIEAFLENPATPQIDTEEIRRIFSLLPATYEAFTEFRPDYDLIHKVIAASAQVTVFADPILITELAASPDLLRELAASPNRNLAFIADRKLVFPKQNFDFKKQRLISLPIDEMLVTHQKNGKWSTFVQASDFISQTNNNKIEVTNLCIIPGDVEWLNGQINNYFVSPKHCFKSSDDQFLLLERWVGEPVSFTIRPSLELKIPEGTPPSVYQGELVFTEL